MLQSPTGVGEKRRSLTEIRGRLGRSTKPREFNRQPHHINILLMFKVSKMLLFRSVEELAEMDLDIALGFVQGAPISGIV